MAPIVVMLIAGVVNVRDFDVHCESEEEAVDRVLRHLLRKPGAGAFKLAQVLALPHDTKRAMAMLLADSSEHDVLGVQQLPQTLRWLQRAAVVHHEAELAARRETGDIDE